MITLFIFPKRIMPIVYNTFDACRSHLRVSLCLTTANKWSTNQHSSIQYPVSSIAWGNHSTIPPFLPYWPVPYSDHEDMLVHTYNYIKARQSQPRKVHFFCLIKNIFFITSADLNNHFLNAKVSKHPLWLLSWTRKGNLVFSIWLLFTLLFTLCVLI